METPEGKVSLLDAIPVRCGHIQTEWEGDYAVISFPGSSMNGCAGFYCRRVCLLIFMSALKNTAVPCGV